MPRRLELQQRVLLKLMEGREVLRRLRPAELLAGGHVEHLTTKPTVAEQSADVVVAAAAAVAELPPVEAAAEFPHRRVIGVWIADERGLARVEVDHAIVHAHPVRKGHRLTPAAGRREPGGSPPPR